MLLILNGETLASWAEHYPGTRFSRLTRPLRPFTNVLSGWVMVLEPRLKAPLFVFVWVTFETHNWGQIISLSSHKAISSSPSLLWHNAQFVNKKNPQWDKNVLSFTFILFRTQCIASMPGGRLICRAMCQHKIMFITTGSVTYLLSCQGLKVAFFFNFEITTNGKAKTLKILDSPQKMVQNWELGPLPKDCVKWGP